jgi:hypothetical protein
MEEGEAMRGGVSQPGRAFQKTMRMACVFCGLLALVDIAGCKGLPTLEQQEQMVRGNNLMLDHVTTRAVVNVWGEPPHHRSEFAHFFVMPDFSMVPRARVPLGEAPPGWNAGLYAGEGVFFAYPDRGWLLVFLNERLVYKEELQAEEMRALLKAWAYEDRFKTSIDGAPAP